MKIEGELGEHSGLEPGEPGIEVRLLGPAHSAKQARGETELPRLARLHRLLPAGQRFPGSLQQHDAFEEIPFLQRVAGGQEVQKDGGLVLHGRHPGLRCTAHLHRVHFGGGHQRNYLLIRGNRGVKAAENRNSNIHDHPKMVARMVFRSYKNLC